MTIATVAPADVRERAARPARPGHAVARISMRLVGLRTVAICIAVGVLIALEAFAFQSGYPSEASRAALVKWAQAPGIRILAGPGAGVNTVGGFVVWDAGVYLILILGAWSLTMAGRVLRGDESSGRTENLLVGPIRAVRALIVQLLVLLAACGVAGIVAAVALAISGADPWGSVLYGAATFGYCTVVVSVVAVASQVFATRIATLASAGGVLVAFILMRMVSNSADGLSWLGYLTPVGWLDQIRAFGDSSWPVLLLPLLVTATLLGIALAIRGVRDTGAGLVGVRTGHRSRAWGLGSPLAFAWRANLGVLAAWAGGVAIAGAVVGTLLPTVDEYLSTDIGFQQILASMGMNLTDLIRGLVGMWATVLGLVIAAYAAFRLGSARAEEASTRAELLLTRPVPRWRWLGGHALCLVASIVTLAAAAAAGMWLAGLVTGAPLTASDAIMAMANTTPVVMVFAGLGILTFGILPRLTVAVTAAVAVAAYILDMVGPILEWPDWMLNISPFHHLADVPVEPFGWGSAAWMVAISVVLAAIGVVAFQRRDLVGAEPPRPVRPPHVTAVLHRTHRSLFRLLWATGT